jgi:hypothetical protein
MGVVFVFRNEIDLERIVAQLVQELASSLPTMQELICRVRAPGWDRDHSMVKD